VCVGRALGVRRARALGVAGTRVWRLGEGGERGEGKARTRRWRGAPVSRALRSGSGAGMVGSRPAWRGRCRATASHPPSSAVLPVAGPSMVARIGFSATTSRESRQGRKAAAAATMSGAGARAGASCLLKTWRAFRPVVLPRPGLGPTGWERHGYTETGSPASAPVGFIHELYRAGA
jgi:hypothetical protein